MLNSYLPELEVSDEHGAVSVGLPSQGSVEGQLRNRNFFPQEQDGSHSDHSPHSDHAAPSKQYVGIELFQKAPGGADVVVVLIASLLIDCFVPMLLNIPFTVHPF